MSSTVSSREGDILAAQEEMTAPPNGVSVSKKEKPAYRKREENGGG
jgi:hypothetical protein